jgi:hypothetical protein
LILCSVIAVTEKKLFLALFGKKLSSSSQRAKGYANKNLRNAGIEAKLGEEAASAVFQEVN